MNLNERFDALDDNLKLDPAVRDRAVRAHNELGDLLVDAGVAKGSLARHTMRGPQLHDIDKIVELDDGLRARLDGPACAGRFVHQVRMAKQAVDHAQLSKVLPGLHVESFAYHAIDATTRDADAVAATLATGDRLLDATYTDPTGVDRLSDRLDPADRAVALAGMQRLAELAEEAQQAATDGDEAAAARIWADVFGDQFPRPAMDARRFLQDLHLGKGASATARILLTLDSPPPFSADVSAMYQEVAMAWKPTGRPTVRQQRDKWVVRVDGIDTTTGKHRPRQLGTYASRRSAQVAATSFAASGEVGADRGTVGHLVDQWVASRLDVSNKTRLMYEWAAGHIREGLGAIRVEDLERE